MINLPNESWAWRLESSVLGGINRTDAYTAVAEIPEPRAVPSSVDRLAGFRMENRCLGGELPRVRRPHRMRQERLLKARALGL